MTNIIQSLYPTTVPSNKSSIDPSSSIALNDDHNDENNISCSPPTVLEWNLISGFLGRRIQIWTQTEKQGTFLSRIFFILVKMQLLLLLLLLFLQGTKLYISLSTVIPKDFPLQSPMCIEWKDRNPLDMSSDGGVINIVVMKHQKTQHLRYWRYFKM